VWLALIVRRSRSLGHVSALHNAKWFIDIFKGGAKVILNCRWILLLPLAALVVQLCESLIWSYVRIKNDPEFVERFSNQPPEPFLSFLVSLWRDVIPEFFTASGTINGAMLHSFRSPFIILVFLSTIMVLLLKTRPTDTDTHSGDLSEGMRKCLGVFSGLVGISFFMVAICSVIIQNPDFYSWMTIPGPFTYFLAWPFGYAILLPAMEAADRGQGMSITAAFSNGECHFRLLFYYVVLTTGVLVAGTLPMYVQSSGPNPIGSYSLWRMKTSFMYALLAMISFVPVIAVMQRNSIASALRSCVDLWARHAKNAPVFLAVSGLLLLPTMLEGRLQRVFAEPYYGWEMRTALFLLALYKVTIGVLIMSSMVVFYRKVLEEDDEAQSETEGI
jgi:hypothetical protein